MRRVFSLAIAGAAIWGVLLVLQSLIPRVADDYGFLNVLNVFGSLLDIALHGYRTWDGRALVGFFINHGLLSLPDFAIILVLSLVPLGVAFSLCVLALGSGWKQKITWIHLLCAFCLLWLSIPAFGEVFFWRVGSGYGILCLLFLLFLMPYRDFVEKGNIPAWGFALCLPLAAAIGLADYNTTVVLAMLALCAATLVCVQSGRFHVLPFLPPLVLLACFYVIFTAPGNAARLALAGTTEQPLWESILVHLKRQPDVQLLYLWSYLLLLVSLFLLWRLKAAALPVRTPVASRPKQPMLPRYWNLLLAEKPLLWTLVFFLAAQAAQAAFLFAPYSPQERAYTSSALFMVLAGLTLFFHVWPRSRAIGWRWPARLYWIPAGVVFAASLVSAAIILQANKQYADASTAAAIAAASTGRDSVCFPPGPYRSSRYAFNGRSMQPGNDPQHWLNLSYATYYGLASVALCKQNFMLLAQSGSGVDFFGEVRDSVLYFTYIPPPDLKDKPFRFAFILPPLNPLRDAFDLAMQEHFGESRIFRRMVRNAYTRRTPEISITEGAEGVPAVIRGTAKMPHVEHTDRAYILHFEGRSVAAVIPLRIVRGGE